MNNIYIDLFDFLDNLDTQRKPHPTPGVGMVLKIMIPQARKENFYDRFPHYVPFDFRWRASVRKLIRQSSIRYWEHLALKNNCPGIIPDGESNFEQLTNGSFTPPSSHINRSALAMDEDLNRPQVKAVAEQLAALKKKMSDRGLMFCSAAGTFVKNTYTSHNERKKLWEDTWVLAHAQVKSGMRVLDIGGASTPFSFYLADIGCSVNVVDNDWGNCGTVYNGNYVAGQMGWDLKTIDWDISRGLPFADGHFDRVFCVCVIEHLTSSTRRSLMKEINRVLKPGGIAGLTTDYDHERKVITTDKGLRFGFKAKFQKDVLEPSGLHLMGNTELLDAKPDENFLGAFFLQKP